MLASLSRNVRSLTKSIGESASMPLQQAIKRWNIIQMQKYEAYASRTRNFLIGPAKANRQGKNRTESREMGIFEGIPTPARQPHFNYGLSTNMPGQSPPWRRDIQYKMGKHMKHGRSSWPGCGETLSTGSGGPASIVLPRCRSWSRSWLFLRPDT